MSEAQVVNVLNRLFMMQQYSLANYLSQSMPWTHSGNGPVVVAIHSIVEDHEHYAQRLADAIDARDCNFESCSFPLMFASLNDLSLDYLVARLIEFQRHDIQTIERYVLELERDPVARSLASEVLGSERAHLEMLQESLPPPGTVPPVDGSRLRAA